MIVLDYEECSNSINEKTMHKSSRLNRVFFIFMVFSILIASADYLVAKDCHDLIELYNQASVTNDLSTKVQLYKQYSFTNGSESEYVGEFKYSKRYGSATTFRRNYFRYTAEFKDFKKERIGYLANNSVGISRVTFNKDKLSIRIEVKNENIIISANSIRNKSDVYAIRSTSQNNKLKSSRRMDWPQGDNLKADLSPIDLYKVEIAFQIEKHWSTLKKQLPILIGLEAVLVFKVLQDGVIKDIKFRERSGNSSLDDAAYRAIEESSPVAPHPAGLKAPYVTIILRFSPY